MTHMQGKGQSDESYDKRPSEMSVTGGILYLSSGPHPIAIRSIPELDSSPERSPFFVRIRGIKHVKESPSISTEFGCSAGELTVLL